MGVATDSNSPEVRLLDLCRAGIGGDIHCHLSPPDGAGIKMKSLCHLDPSQLPCFETTIDSIPRHSSLCDAGTAAIVLSFGLREHSCGDII